METRTFLLSLSVVALVLFVFLGGQIFYETAGFPETATAATTSAVTVTANVTAAISCDTNPASTAFGTLTDTVVTTSTPNTSSSLSCANSALGCVLYIKGTGSTTQPGLWSTSTKTLIESPNITYSATATLAAGTEGYGIHGTTTAAGGGDTLDIVLRYVQWNDNTVGGLATSAISMASTNATTSNREIVVKYKAAISNQTTGASDYEDSIEYFCVGN